MTAYLSYSYSTGLTKEEQIQIDKKTGKSRKEFSKGFGKGISLSLAAYSLYLLSISAACAADVPAPQNPPGDAGAVKPTSKPSFKPLQDGTKCKFVGGASAVCAATLQSKDFYLGLAFAFLLVVGGIVINRS
jgi:hypothetical protein